MLHAFLPHDDMHDEMYEENILDLSRAQPYSVYIRTKTRFVARLAVQEFWQLQEVFRELNVALFFYLILNLHED